MVTARLELRLTEPAAQPDAVGHFDREFVFSRGRSISLALRFADVWRTPGCFVATGRIGARIVSALLVQPFTWIDDAREWRGAMIGMVCTDPQHRGKGYAAELMTAAEERCRSAGYAFAVLWAARHELYRRLGWIPADNGLLGVHYACRQETAKVADAPDLLPRIHALHERRQARVRRDLASYARLLPPSRRVVTTLDGNAFAVCGEDGGTGYVHDLSGVAADLSGLWTRLTVAFERLYVNVRTDSSEHAWLVQNTTLEWKRQSLTLWKPLKAPSVPFQDWYLPFLDRI